MLILESIGQDLGFATTLGLEGSHAQGEELRGSTMDLERCFEVLEIDRNASADEIRQAYKDIVSVWHPDRFRNNPRLRRKAEKKLKENEEK